MALRRARWSSDRVQVPEAPVSSADRISQKCPHDWIEAFLMSHRELRSADQLQGDSRQTAQTLPVQAYDRRSRHGAGPPLPP